MHKIAVIGTVDTVKLYRALGLETFEAETGEHAHEILKTLIAPDTHYGIIYLEEHFADACEEEVVDMLASPRLSICVIPGRNGSEGRGSEAVTSAITRAIGADIL